MQGKAELLEALFGQLILTGNGYVEAVAAEAGKTLAQVALNWCTSHPNVIAIPKSDRVDRALENCGASGWRLSSNQVKTLDAAFSTS